MKRLACAALILIGFAAGPALAQTFLSADELGELYLLDSTRNASSARVWMLRVINPDHPSFRGRPERSAKILVELDCREANARHTFIYFAQMNPVGTPLEESRGNWKPIAPDTLASRAQRIACK